MKKLILALDTATKTGFAYSFGKERHSGSYNFNFHPHETLGCKLIAFHNWLEDHRYLKEGTTNTKPPFLVVYEKAHFRGSGSYLLSGLTSVLNLWCCQVGAICQYVPSRSLKKYATGNGNSTKVDMANALKTHPDWKKTQLVDDNQVDAIWLLQYAIDNCKLWTGEHP